MASCVRGLDALHFELKNHRPSDVEKLQALKDALFQCHFGTPPCTWTPPEVQLRPQTPALAAARVRGNKVRKVMGL